MSALVALVALVAAIALFAGIYSRQSPRHSGPRRSSEPQAICQCGHGWAFHDDDGRGCHQQRYNPMADAMTPCACVRYTGPEPLPLVIP